MDNKLDEHVQDISEQFDCVNERLSKLELVSNSNRPNSTIVSTIGSPNLQSLRKDIIRILQNANESLSAAGVNELCVVDWLDIAKDIRRERKAQFKSGEIFSSGNVNQILYDLLNQNSVIKIDEKTTKWKWRGK